MSTSRGSGGRNVVQPIPAGARKVVQSLKEVVNCSEAEIYAILKDCNMDPNEAVNRLLSQDPFHEVKSKREKKKEGKDTNESRPCGANNTNRGGKSGADLYLGHGGSTSYYSSEPASMHGKSTYKKESEATPYTSSLPSASSLSGNNSSRGTAGLSDDTSAENKGPSCGMADGMASGIRPPSTSHSSWVGTPGQVSMADIVKMGIPHKSVNAPNGSHNNVQGLSATTVHNEPRFLDDHTSKDEWPTIEKPAAPIVTFAPESIVDSHVHPEESVVHFDSENQYSESEEDQETLDDYVETTAVNDVGSHSFSSRKFPDDDSRGGPRYENDLYKNMGSYLPQAHDFERHEVEEGGAWVSSVTRHLEQLSVEKDDRNLPSEGDAPSLIIPDHLQVQSVDCSHLRFGSFGSGMSIPYSSRAAMSLPVETNSKQRHTAVDVPSVGHADTSYGDDSFRNAADGSLYHRNGAGYDTSSASQPEQLKSESAEVQYNIPSSNHPGYSYDNAQFLDAAFSQTNTEMQNQPPVSNVMSYPSSLPSTLLGANIQPSRESELQHSPLPITPAMAAKYGISASALGGSAISMSEALKAAGISSMQPAPHNLSGASVAPRGQPLPQHLAMHPYSQHSQPALSLGPFANMIGYPLMPQSYGYMSSAFQQSIANNSTYHQSLAAMPPQYKNSVSTSSVPHSAAIASGYGGLGNRGTISGNFQMNPPAAALSGSSLSYDDVFSSQYKDNSHLISLLQNENSSMWPYRANSRTMSAVPSGTYYNYQGQSQQQPGGFRQSRQTSPNYPNLYHSQAQQQDQPQNPRSRSQGQQPKQSQIWQNDY